jgi:hypothetical protein
MRESRSIQLRHEQCLRGQTIKWVQFILIGVRLLREEKTSANKPESQNVRNLHDIKQ